MRDIFDRLRSDAGQLTIGSLIQEREAAAAEIARLRKMIERLTASNNSPPKEQQQPQSGYSPDRVRPSVTPGPSLQLGGLLRLRDVCKLLGISRSTLYKRVGEKTFPKPVRISERSVRWRVEDVKSWRDALENSAQR